MHITNRRSVSAIPASIVVATDRWLVQAMLAWANGLPTIRSMCLLKPRNAWLICHGDELIHRRGAVVELSF